MKVFDFDDVQLLPKRCIVKSRSECKTDVTLGKHNFKLPIVPANMASILDKDLAVELVKNGYFYVMHRFNFDSYSFVKEMKEKKLIASISLGIKEDDYKLIEKLAKDNLVPDYITIDIAHGHSNEVKILIEKIRELMGDEPFIIAGNVATPEGIYDLERWGADATKLGVGPGKVCITKLKTGFGTGGWQLSALNSASKSATKPIIVDGGLKYHGDIAKALRFGATMAMVGSILAAHEESPGKQTEVDGIKYKEYFGSASEFNKGEKRHVEGIKELQVLKGSIWDKLIEIQQDLQSSISYAGGNDLSALKKVRYVLLKNNEGL